VAALAVYGPSAQAQVPLAAAPVTIDGPAGNIIGLSGFSVARDGTGGIVYLKTISGLPKVFVSRLVGGTFQAPEEIDASLPGSSSQPVIAAGNGGVLLIAFINSGSLFVVDRPGITSPYLAPDDLFAGASNPAIQMSNFGKAYLAFTAAGSGGDDVRAAYYYNGQWSLESTPLDAVAGDDAGTGSGRPAVAAAGDGVGIVAWGENGHIFVRRVWGTSPSIAYEQADPATVGASTEVNADDPNIGVGGDSTYPEVVFHEQLSNGGVTQSRVLMRRLHGSLFDGITQPDGVTIVGSAGADQPEISDSEYGRGIVSAEHDDSHQLWATLLGNSGTIISVARADSLVNLAEPDATSGMDGLVTGLLAWQQTPGSAGIPEIRGRFDNGSALGPEQVLSSPTLGPTNADSGLLTAGDSNGDGAVAWVQGSGSQTRIVADQLYQPPGGLPPVTQFRYVRTLFPRLSWTAANEPWGPLRYLVTVSQVQIAQTTATALTVPAPLAQGAHSWSVVGVNPVGTGTNVRSGIVWVDTVPPAVNYKLTGQLRPHSILHLTLSYTDTPPPVPRGAGSGIASVVVKWGDGTSYRIGHSKYHLYARPGTYRLTIIVKDRAGNTTTVVRKLKIVIPKPKPKKSRTKPKSSGPSKSKTGGAHV
jgi:hypothetical protein